TADGLALGAWLVEAGEPDRGLAVLVANGNAGNRSLRAPLARALERGRGSGGVAVRLPRLRGQSGATERAGARPRCSRGAPVSDRRGRGSAGAPPVLRREPWLGGGDRARD